ncbi:MAG: hypothetical protein WDN26_07040 [Chitinophagaceae bacterium]
MKYLLLLLTLILFHTFSIAQKFNSGTYTFNYCDLEYNRCLGTCKVVIEGDSITIYATKELAGRITLIKEGDIIDQGIVLKHKSGKWIVGKIQKDKNAKDIGIEGPAIIDFKKKQYWTF